MSTAIQNILEHTLGDGARPSKFDIQLMMPTSSLFPDEVALSVLAKTTSFPSKQHEIITLKHKGRSIPMKGQVRYTHSWDCTFYLTEDHSLKIAIEQWIEALDQKNNYDNSKTLGVSELQNYFANADTGYTMPIIITQKNFELDEDTVVYTLQNAFPISVNPVELSSENTGNISEFTVTFAYSHYLINAVHVDNNTVEEFKLQINNIIQNALDSVTNYATNAINGITSNIEQTISNSINGITSEITGAATNVVDDLAQSINSFF